MQHVYPAKISLIKKIYIFFQKNYNVCNILKKIISLQMFNEI